MLIAVTLARNKTNRLRYMKMSEALRTYQHVAICFLFSPVTDGVSQFSMGSREELTSAKSYDIVPVCVLSLYDGIIKYKTCQAPIGKN